MEFREMTLDDFNKISNNLDIFDDFWNKNIFKEELSNPSTYYIMAIDNNEIVGFGGLSFVLNECNLNNIAVNINKRNHKIGTQILSNLINIAREKEVKFMTLEVRVDNLPAIKLYENFGFKKVGIRKHYYNNKIDALLMTLFI